MREYHGSVMQLSSLRASPLLEAHRDVTRHSQYLLRATRLALTAIESSMGSSGGTTEVMMMTQSSKSLERLRSCSRPATTQACICNVRKKGNIPRGSATEGGREELTLDPNVSTRGKRKDEEEPNEQERFEVVGRDRLGREDHSPDQLSLTGPESGAENDGEATTVGRRERVRRVCNAGRLEDLGTTEEDRVAVDAVDVEAVRARTEFDGFLQERGRLAGEHGLVDDGGSTKQQEVARDARIFFGADCGCFERTSISGV